MTDELKTCPHCDNPYLAIRTDVYKDKREFIYCDCCGAMADRKTWVKAVNQPKMRHVGEATVTRESAWINLDKQLVLPLKGGKYRVYFEFIGSIADHIKAQESSVANDGADEILGVNVR